MNTSDTPIPKISRAAIESLSEVFAQEKQHLLLVFDQFESLARQLIGDLTPLDEQSTDIGAWFGELQSALIEAQAVKRSLDSEEPSPLINESKEFANWVFSLDEIIFESVLHGFGLLEQARDDLINKTATDFALHLASASVCFGGLKIIYKLDQGGILNRINAHNFALDGARKGGARSARTRKNQSKVPDANSLSREAAELAKTKGRREVASMLAKKYAVTSDYIRKLLNGANTTANKTEPTSNRE